MRTRNLSLLTLVTILLATSCMPDSFTKFKEDPPTKTSASGGSTGTVVDPTPTPTPTPDVSDVVFEVESVELYQSRGDTYLIKVIDGTQFNIGDVINTSATLFPADAPTTNTDKIGTFHRAGTIIGITQEDTTATDVSRILVVRVGDSILEGASACDALPCTSNIVNSDYDNNFATTDQTDHQSNSFSLYYKFFAEDYYIDNCPVVTTVTPYTGGYGACSPGAAAITKILGTPILYVESDPPSTDPFPLATGKNISKRIRINGSGTADVSTYDWDYSFSTNINGLGVRVGTSDSATIDGASSNDRLVSPYGPFAIAANQDFGTQDATKLTISVALNSGDYGTQLDTEEQGSVEVPFATFIPGTAVETIQEFELTYYIEDGQRFAIEVENVAPFVAGFNDGSRTIVRACRATSGTSCNQDVDSVAIFGKATIDHIDELRNMIYLTAIDFDLDGDGRDEHSLFREGLFIHNGNSAGTVTSTAVSMQSSKVYRLFNDISGPASAATTVINPEWNVQNDGTEGGDDDPDDVPTTVTYSIDKFPASGFTIDPSTGVITITHANISSLDLDVDITVTATDDANGGVIDTFVFNFNSIVAPGALTFDDGSTSKDLKAYLNTNTADDLDIENAGDLITSTVRLGSFRFEATPTLPSGASLDPYTGAITWAPTTFNSTTTNYTIRAFLPAYNPGTTTGDAIGSVTAKFLSATKFEKIVYDQQAGDILILKVDKVDGFSTNGKVSTPSGALGTINFIDTTNKRLFISVDNNLVGCSSDGNSAQVFAPGDTLDSTSSYIIERAQIDTGDDGVVHVFSTTSTAFDAGRTPKFCLNNGILVTLDSTNTEERNTLFAITPTPPADMTFSDDIFADVGTTGDGSFTAVSAGDLGNLSETTYTIAVSNELGETILSNYTMTVIETPDLPSFNRYQFIRITGDTESFYRGTRWQTGGQDQVSGRVLMTVDTDNDQVIDGLLVEGNGDIPNGAGMDNAEVFFADEVLVEGYEFWYVKASASFSVNDQIQSGDGATGTIRAKDDDSSRLYVQLGTGEFNSSDTITKLNADGSLDTSVTTTIKSVQRRHYVTGVVQITNSTDWSRVIVGESITWDANNDGDVTDANDGAAIVVQKHVEDNNTKSNSTDDRYYVLLQHVKGDLVRENETLNIGTDASSFTTTVQSIVGPVVNVYVAGGTGWSTTNFARSSSSGRVDADGNPFYIGNMIAAFTNSGAVGAGTADGTLNNYVSVGEAVYGTDYDAASPIVTVAVEDFYRHFKANGATYFIDDFTESHSDIGMQSQPHNRISDIGMSNLIIGYVGEPLYVSPSLKGEFASASLSPNIIPTGLTFDTTTGVLSGTPSEPFSGTNYTITFRTADGTGTATYSFPLTIYNVFEITQKTTEASSYMVHKEGQGMGSSRCRVNSAQIIDDVNDPNYNQAVYGLNDIVCVLEGGESDLYNRGIEFDIKYGAGMCEYVEYVPFSYQSLPAGSSTREVTVYPNFTQASLCSPPAIGVTTNRIFFDGDAIGTFIGDTSGATSSHSAVFGAGFAADDNGSLAGGNQRTFDTVYCENGSSDCVEDRVASDVCSYDYSQLDSDYPNLDSGTIRVNTVSCEYTTSTTDEDDGAGGGPDGLPDDVICKCDVVTTDVDCGGRSVDGLAGPKRDEFPTTYDQFSGQILTTVTGGSSSRSVSSPISKGLGTNKYLANFVSHRNYLASTNGLPATTAVNPSCYASNHHMDGHFVSGGTTKTITGNRASWEGYSASYDPFGNSRSSLYNNFYTFNCLDASYDIKARIRLMVRDWDREFTPEEHELTNLAANFHYSGDLGPITITTAGSTTGTLSTTLPANIVIGNGTEFYIDDGDNTLELDGSDTRLVVESYTPGSTTVTFRGNTPSTTDEFFIRSRSNDNESNSFSVAFDNRADFDSSYINLLAQTYRPDYSTCGTGDQTVAPGQSISLTGGSYTATFSTAINLPSGTMLEVSTAGTPATIRVTILSGSGTTYTLAHPAQTTVSPVLGNFSVIRNIPFPMEVPK